MIALWSLASRNAWAHRAGLTGSALVLALAAVLLAVTGVLLESGLRANAGPTASGSGTLLVLAGSFSGTVLAVAVLVVISVVSLALRGRQRELALLRTVGATGAQLRRHIGVEILLVAIVAAPPGAVIGLALAPLLNPLLRDSGLIDSGDALLLGPAPVLGATALVLPVAWIAARFACRETLRVPRSQAVRGGTVEVGTVGAYAERRHTSSATSDSWRPSALWWCRVRSAAPAPRPRLFSWWAPLPSPVRP